MTEYFNWENGIVEYELNICAKVINDNGLVVFPTETVYGIGANALNSDAVKKIFIAKGRESDNPLIVHISNKKMINDLVEEVNKIEQKLIDAFMPGPFTLILKKKNIIPDIVSARLDTVGIRMPSNEIARVLIEKSGIPIAAPSANISGRPSGTDIEDIKEELNDKVDIIIDCGKSDIGLESTVVKVIDRIPNILRPGKITPEDIKNVIGIVKIDNKVYEKVDKEEIIESPGMKYKHYAPKTKSVLVYNEDENEQIRIINDIIEKEKNACILGFNEHREKIMSKNYIEMGSINNLEEISKNIFTLLRKADNIKADLIIIEGVKKEGLGIAIMNRLIRACGYNTI